MPTIADGATICALSDPHDPHPGVPTSVGLTLCLTHALWLLRPPFQIRHQRRGEARRRAEAALMGLVTAAYLLALWQLGALLATVQGGRWP